LYCLLLAHTFWKFVNEAPDYFNNTVTSQRELGDLLSDQIDSNKPGKKQGHPWRVIRIHAPAELKLLSN
jgi:hypothetical protein